MAKAISRDSEARKPGFDYTIYSRSFIFLKALSSRDDRYRVLALYNTYRLHH